MRLDNLLAWFGSKPSIRKSTWIDNDLTQCLNCDQPIKEEDHFCAHCGQKKHPTRLTVWTLVSEFFSSLLNFDNGIYRSLRGVFVPAKLAREFVAGRRKQYFNPIRLFLVSLVVLLSLASKPILNLDKLRQGGLQPLTHIGESQVYDRYLKWQEQMDSIEISDWRIDSLEATVFDDLQPTYNDTIGFNANIGTINLKNYHLTYKEAYQDDIDEVLESKDIERSFDRFVIGQMMRTMRDPAGALQFAYGNAIWTVSATIFQIAFLMQLLYIRRKRYYVEHLVVLFNAHSFNFVLLSIVLLVDRTTSHDLLELILPWTIPITGIYVLVTIKRYYGQGWIKSILKTSIIALNYFICFALMSVLILLASIAIFQ